MRRRSMLEVCAIGLAAAVFSPRLAMAVQKTEIRMARPFNLKEKAVKFNNGRTMPVLGLGTYSLHGQTCIRAVRAALDCGVRLIDTASMYGNEREVGMAQCKVTITNTIPSLFDLSNRPPPSCLHHK